MSLFGTADLTGGPLLAAARPLLAEFGEERYATFTGQDVAKTIPVAASMTQGDMILLGRPGTDVEGQAFWVVHDLVESWPSFADMLLSRYPVR